MTNKKSTKRALLSSALALVMCISMLIGSTFAWFTDSVTSSGNIIQSGSLKVTMEWLNGKDDPTATDAAWKDASEGAIFNSTLWEPGYTEVRHIKIENEGTLALKYKLNIVANGEVSDLADVIDVYYIDPATEAITDRTQLTDDKKIGTLTEVLAGLEVSGNGVLVPAGKEGDGYKSVETITIALKMQESAGNEYQEKAIGSDFAIQLLATQFTYEEDSFDNQYDKDATYPVTNAEELTTYISEGKSVVLNNDIEMSSEIAVKKGNVTIDLAGNNLVFADDKYSTLGASSWNPDVTPIVNIVNSSEEKSVMELPGYNDGEDYYPSIIASNGIVNVENVEIKSTNATEPVIMAQGGTVNISNSTLTSNGTYIAQLAAGNMGENGILNLTNCQISVTGSPQGVFYAKCLFGAEDVVLNLNNCEISVADTNVPLVYAESWAVKSLEINHSGNFTFNGASLYQFSGNKKTVIVNGISQ